MLMLSILANGVLFFHTHELENGKIITHAHPILTEEQQELPDHGHTESELIILDLIAHAEYFVYGFKIDLPTLTFENQFFYFSLYSDTFSRNSVIGFDHRGPPALV
jgi:hypothetical protein